MPYRAQGRRSDVLAGQVQVFITTPPSVMQHVQGQAEGLRGDRQDAIPDCRTCPRPPKRPRRLRSWKPGSASSRRRHAGPGDRQGQQEAVRRPWTPRGAGERRQTGIELRYLAPDALGALVTKETEYRGKLIKSRNITAD
jgi:hypothetical protein